MNQYVAHEDDNTAAALATLCIIFVAALQARMAQRLNRNNHRLYLLRSNLLPNPRCGTPWQQLWDTQDDRAFITTMGFDVATFRYILEGPQGFAEHWEATPVL